jgi:general secretion pathway protein G
MMQRIWNKRDNDEAFTLIELLIVIVVLGILAAIVIFGVGTFRSDSVNAACTADKKTVEIALEAYKAKTGAYPANNDFAALVTAGYLKSAPTSPEYTITFAGGTVSGTKC